MYYEELISKQLLYDLLIYVLFMVGIALIIILAFKSVERWKVKVEIDDGRIIRYANAKEKGRVVKQGENGETHTFILVEYKDKVSKRRVEALIPEHPAYMRIKSFMGGLVKAVVYRVDSNGNPMPYTHVENVVVPADTAQYIKTHEMLMNSLRTKLVFKNIMLYIIIMMIILLVFAGFIVWQVSSRPVEVIIQQPQTTQTPLPKPPIG